MIDERYGCCVWRWDLDRGDYPMITESPGHGAKPRKVLIARYMWERAHGPIPRGLTVDHFLYNGGECAGRPCVEVSHLRLVTRGENTRSAPRNAAKAAQRLCKYGHPFDHHSTYIARNGTRKCRTDQRRGRPWNLLPREAPYVPAGWEDRALEFERQAVGVLNRLAEAENGLGDYPVGEEVISWLLKANLVQGRACGLLRLTDRRTALVSEDGRREVEATD
jgi:hypothetical protein